MLAEEDHSNLQPEDGPTGFLHRLDRVFRVDTSYVERQNLIMRMSMRRFTRLTNAFSKKVENLAHAVALHFMHYNFARIHRSLRVTPAMEAGVADHVWTLEEIIGLLDEQEQQAIAAGALKRGSYRKKEISN